MVGVSHCGITGQNDTFRINCSRPSRIPPPTVSQAGDFKVDIKGLRSTAVLSRFRPFLANHGTPARAVAGHLSKLLTQDWIPCQFPAYFAGLVLFESHTTAF